MSDLSESIYAEDLIELLAAAPPHDIGLDYKMPHITKMFQKFPERKARIIPFTTVRLPSRLCSPLIEYPQFAAEFFMDPTSDTARGLNQLTLDNLYSAKVCVHRYLQSHFISPYQASTKISDFLDTVNLINEDVTKVYSITRAFIYSTAHKLSNKCLELDMNQARMRQGEQYPEDIPYSKPPGYLELMTKVRAAMTRKLASVDTPSFTYHDSDDGFVITTVGGDGFLICPPRQSSKWFILLTDRVTVMYHTMSGVLSVTPSTFSDYAMTRFEVLHNLKLLSNSSDSTKYKLLTEWLISTTNHIGKHVALVSFMKSYEGVVNMIADFKASSFCSVASFRDGLQELCIISKDIDGIEVTAKEFIMLCFKSKASSTAYSTTKSQDSLLLKLAIALRDLSPVELLEASSFHKFLHYAVIDEFKGIEKYAKRTMTERPVKGDHIKLLRAKFNQIYVQTYIKRHNRLPKILLDSKKYNELQPADALKEETDHSLAELYGELALSFKLKESPVCKTKPLIWWYAIRPYDTEDSVFTGNPIEHAKDKRACLKAGDHSLKCSVKELDYIMRQEKVGYWEMPKTHARAKNPQSINHMYQGQIAYDTQYATMLKQKEREQKLEGRLFGMFTVEGKQTISRYMRHCEHVLSYFDGNLVTESDKKRKMKLHRMAQKLLDPDKYSLLADIEGHNQSMQPGNTMDLITSIGLIYNIDVFPSLATLFNNLHVFYAFTHTDDAYSLEGQLGGIEGWYNPIWTLHSTLVVKLIPELTTIDLVEEAVYSDDISAVITLVNPTQSIINEKLEELQDHFRGFGLILKASQTVVSKYRITMLRQHYAKGIRASAAYKRMLSISNCGSSLFQADDLEVASISSAASSALELSNSVQAITYLKWVRIIETTLRAFCSSFNTKIDIQVLECGLFSEKFINLYKTNFDYSGINPPVWIIDDIKKLSQKYGPNKIREYLVNTRMMVSSRALADDQAHAFRSDLIRLLESEEGFQILFFLIHVFPSSKGGYGTLTLEQSALSGMTDSLSRVYGILRNTVKHSAAATSLVNLLITYVTGIKGRFSRATWNEGKTVVDKVPMPGNQPDSSYEVETEELSLCQSEWPQGRRHRSSQDLIKQSLLSYFKANCKNKELLNMFQNYEHKANLCRDIVDQLRGSFTFRMAAFYAEHNGFLIIDKIIRKVENTSSVLRACPKFKRLVKESSQVVVTGPRNLLQRPNFSLGQLNNDVTIQEYLYRTRAIAYPGVKFLEMIEPEPNEYLEQVVTDTWHIKQTSTAGIIFDGGISRYLPPLFGTEALYKGETRDKDAEFSSINEALMIKLISITKWAIYRSDPINYEKNIREPTNLSNCADMCLATLGFDCFERYKSHVPLCARSEVMHRIPILDSKPVASVRSLPSFTTKFRTTWNTREMQRLNLADSNLHFSLFELRIILSEAINMSINEIYKFSSDWRVKPSVLVRDVQFSYVSLKPKCFLSRYKSISLVNVAEERPTRIRWLSDNLSAIEAGDLRPVVPKLVLTDQIEILTDNVGASLIIEHSKKLFRSSMWDLSRIWSESTWAVFLDKHNDLLKKDGFNTVEQIVSYLRNRYSQAVRDHKKSIGDMRDDLQARYFKAEYLKEFTEGDDAYKRCLEQVDRITSALKMNGLLPSNNKATIMADMNILHREKYELLNAAVRNYVVSNCIVIRKSKTGYDIDLPATYSIIEKAIYDPNLFDENRNNEVLLFNLLTSQMGKEDVVRACTEVSELFAAYAGEYNKVIEISESSIVKTLKENPVLPESIDRDIEHYHPVRSFSLNLQGALIDPTTLDLISLTYKVSHNCGDISIFESPLGSDTYTVMNSICKLLKSSLIKPEEYHIVDLTAGRGETCLAFLDNSYRVTAYGRLDEYTSVVSVSGIIMEESYDLLDVKTMVSLDAKMKACLDTKGHDKQSKIFAIIDLSYVKEDHKAFCDLVFNVLNSSDYLLCRFDDKFVKSLQLAPHESLSRITSQLLVTGNAYSQSPANYILMRKAEGAAVDVALDNSNDVWQRYLLGKCVWLIRNPCSIEKLHRCKMNSTLFETSLSKLSARGHLEIIGEMDKDMMHKWIAKIRSLYSQYKTTAISKRLYDALSEAATHDSLKAFYDQRSIDDYLAGALSSDPIVIAELWESLRTYGSAYMCEVTKLNITSAAILRQYHPVSTARSYFAAICSYAKNTGQENNVTIEMIHANLLESNVELPSVALKKGKDLKLAAMFLYYDVWNKAPGEYLKILRLATAAKGSSMRYTQRSIALRRKLQPIYGHLVTKLDMSNDFRSTVKTIVEYLINNALRVGQMNLDLSRAIHIVDNSLEPAPAPDKPLDKQMFELFKEGIKKMIDLDALGHGIIELEGKFKPMANAAFTSIGAADAILREESIISADYLRQFTTPISVLDHDAAVVNKLRREIAKFDDEGDEEYEKRLKELAIIVTNGEDNYADDW